MKRILLVVALLALSACDKSKGMETRTYPIARLTADEALALITPYVNEGGYLSGRNKIITVRERPERLALIEEMLKKYDGGGVVQDVAMNIQIVEANGFTARDSSIADIEATLRGMFKYRGYRLAGETHVRGREDTDFERSIGTYRVAGHIGRLTGDRTAVNIELWDKGGTKRLLSSTVTATMGKPLVLGQSADSGAIILVIRPTLAGT